MQHIDRKAAKTLQKEAETFCDNLTISYGVRASASVSYTGNTGRAATLRIDVTAKGQLTDSEKAFLEHAPHYGISPLALGERFTSNGQSHKITGWRTRAKDYQVSTETLSGKAYKFTARQIAERFPNA
jgi:hypothetical protein